VGPVADGAPVVTQIAEEECTAQLEGLSERQLKTLADWEAKFRAKYGVVGQVGWLAGGAGRGWRAGGRQGVRVGGGAGGAGGGRGRGQGQGPTGRHESRGQG
jgi:hypothetical protein